MVTEQSATELQQEQADVLGEMLAQADIAASYRDQSIPEGALLGEADIPGQQVRWKKPKSMVHAGNVPLPERFVAYDRDGVASMLPTAQMGRMLSKPRADDPSTRAFHTHSGGITQATCRICPEAPAYIEQSCEFCLERTHGAVHKKFRNETDAYRHKASFHPDELANLERMTERAERQAEIATNRALAEAMMAMARANSEAANHTSAAETAATPAKAKP